MAIVEPISSQAERVPAEPRTLLRGVSWAVYAALREIPENGHVRMTYDRGVLEIMSPSSLHEQFAYLIGQLIDVWTDELEIDVTPVRTLTVKREDLSRGLEPDNCYYVRNEPLVWNKRELDFRSDPPPDLAIEVELSTGPRDKLAVYAALGVPEVWRYDGAELRVYELIEGAYVVRRASVSFPGFPLAKAEATLNQAGSVRNRVLVRRFRDHVRKVVLPGLRSREGEGPSGT